MEGKKFLPKPNNPFALSKVKWSAPNSRVIGQSDCRICDNMLVSLLPKYRHFCTAAHFTFSKTQQGCKLDNVDSTLGVIRCGPLLKILETSLAYATSSLRELCYNS